MEKTVKKEQEYEYRHNGKVFILTAKQLTTVYNIQAETAINQKIVNG